MKTFDKVLIITASFLFGTTIFLDGSVYVPIFGISSIILTSWFFIRSIKESDNKREIVRNGQIQKYMNIANEYSDNANTYNELK